MPLNLNETAIVSATIGAGAGLGGVIIGSALSWVREIWAARTGRARQARYLAIRVVCILDRYVETCADVVGDDGLSYGQRDQQGFLRAQVSTPPPPSFPDDLDWKSINYNLMYRILSMPNEADRANGKISSVSEYVAMPPDFDEFFEERQDQYSQLGLSAFAVTEELREEYRIPRREFGDWDPVERLTTAKIELELHRRKRAEAIAASPPLA